MCDASCLPHTSCVPCVPARGRNIHHFPTSTQPLRHLPQPLPADRPVDGRDAEDSSSSSETWDEDEDSDGQSDSSERKTRFLAGLPIGRGAKAAAGDDNLQVFREREKFDSMTLLCCRLFSQNNGTVRTTASHWGTGSVREPQRRIFCVSWSGQTVA